MSGFVAGGVFAVLDVDRVVGHLLDAAADEPAVAFLRRHAFDLGFLGVDVVGDGVHRVGRRPLLEDGMRNRRFAFHRVGLAVGVYLLGLHVDAHVVRLEVARLVGYVAFVVDVDRVVRQIVDQRVLVLARDDVVEKTASAPAGCVGGHGGAVGAAAERIGGRERARSGRRHRAGRRVRAGGERVRPLREFALPEAQGAQTLPAFAARFGGGLKRGCCGVRTFDSGSDRGGGERVRCCGEGRRAEARIAEYPLGEQQGRRRRNEIFYPLPIQNSKIFRIFADVSAKTPETAFRRARAAFCDRQR